MCGIVGVVNREQNQPVEEQQMRQMLALLRHRGPDQFGIFIDQGVGLGSARLSIIDLSSGQQPIGNEDGTLWIIFNGEIFNYVELRPELEARPHVQHQFRHRDHPAPVRRLWPRLPAAPERSVRHRHLEYGAPGAVPGA